MTRLKECRKALGKTQADIAVLIGVTRGAYANIESGRREPDLNTIATLSDFYNVTFDYLLGRGEKKEASPSIDDELASLLQEPLMKDIYDAALQLSPDHRKMVLAQIAAVKALEDSAKK